jgi:putative heme-binding domain-containing protein
VRGQGGALGPDLTAIGAARSREALTTALRDPSAAVALGFRAVKLRARGELVEGVVKGEDAFSLQVVSVDNDLRAFPKRELDELERSTKSLMPVFDVNRLSDSALEDLLAYLGTLRGT